MNFSCPSRAGRRKIFSGKFYMKVQMRFQKILATCSLIVAAITIVSAIIFMSGNLADIMYYRDDDVVKDFCASAQSFVNTMFILTIVYLCMVVVFYFTDSNKRRNYYITNYVATGLAIAGALVVAFYGIIFTSVLLGNFYGLDWEEFQIIMDIASGMGGPIVGKAPTMFIISYITSFLALVNAVAIGLNLLWKVKLMKGEKALLEKSLVKEVA